MHHLKGKRERTKDGEKHIERCQHKIRRLLMTKKKIYYICLRSEEQFEEQPPGALWRAFQTHLRRAVWTTVWWGPNPRTFQKQPGRAPETRDLRGGCARKSRKLLKVNKVGPVVVGGIWRNRNIARASL